MRAQRPHAGLQRCVEEIDRRRPNLGRIPCEGGNVREAMGTDPNRRYTDLQRHVEKRCLRRGWEIELTIAGPLRQPPSPLHLDPGGVFVWVRANTGLKHACFHGGRWC